MKINGRLILILCAVALFVRIWNVNGRNPQRAALPRNAASIGSRSLAATKKTPYPTLRPAAAQRQPSIAAETHTTSREEIWTTQSAPFKLPEGLASGSYRAVSDLGRVALLSIESATKSSGTSADFVALSTECERWYLIRLKPETKAERPSLSTAWQNLMPAVPDLPLSPSAPVANRKFDFTGYVPAAAKIDVPLISEPIAGDNPPATPVEPLLQQAERPAPPELPSPL